MRVQPDGLHRVVAAGLGGPELVESRDYDPIMVASPSAALDLPLKMLVSEDSAGDVWLSYNSTDYLQTRHGISEVLAKNIAVVEGLAKIACA